MYWPSLGGTHDQNVYCDIYAHRISVTAFAAPMWYHHAGQVVKADVYLHDTRVAGWKTFPGCPLVDKVMPSYLGSAILGSAGNETDWEYPMSTLGTFSTPTLSGHSYQVYVYYTFYNDARQVMATGMHATSNYVSGYLGVQRAGLGPDELRSVLQRLTSVPTRKRSGGHLAGPLTRAMPERSWRPGREAISGGYSWNP